MKHSGDTFIREIIMFHPSCSSPLYHFDLTYILLGRGSHPFQYHRPNAYTDGLKSFFSPRTIATLNGLTTEAVSAETVDGFKAKIAYNILGLGRG